MLIITAVTQNHGDSVKSQQVDKITVFTVIVNLQISYSPSDVDCKIQISLLTSVSA